jgi:dinuclear metal center YbgI/SA1388 family protein
MILSAILAELERFAPPSLQEAYDNSGLLTGHPDMEISGALVCLDSTEEVIDEAIRMGSNLVIAHHPIVFSGLKRLNGRTYIERTIIKAIRNDIAIYAIHTNLDNVITGVNHKIGQQLGLSECRILSPLKGKLRKLVTYVPKAHAEMVRDSLFQAGAGQIGHYSECSFTQSGTGTFKGDETSNPVIGEKGKRHYEPEERIEMILPAWVEHDVMKALRGSHPYEEIAYQLYTIENPNQDIGAGLIGQIEAETDTLEFLDLLKSRMRASVVRHTRPIKQKIRTVAVCGGSGSFLLPEAIRQGADVFVTADFKYHQFFDAEGKILIADIGHFESEQFTIDLLAEFLQEKFTTFAVRLTEINTNPIHYR